MYFFPSSGKKGEIIYVSPALWTNVLQPKKQAVKISEEEIAKENAIKAAQEKEKLDKALQLACEIEDCVSNSRIKVPRKVGASGQLFGSVAKKTVLEILKQQFKLPDDEKVVGVALIKVGSTNTDGDVIFSEEIDEIRRAGVFQSTVQLHAKVFATFEVEVISEK